MTCILSLMMIKGNEQLCEARICSRICEAMDVKAELDIMFFCQARVGLSSFNRVNCLSVCLESDAAGP
jgi:hypothetical protein